MNRRATRPRATGDPRRPTGPVLRATAIRWRRPRRLLSAATGTALAITLAGAGTAQAHESGQAPPLRVMTQNLYLGADLTPALVATDPTSFLTAVATIYGSARATDFAVRADAIAEEVRTGSPDLIGLQEVARWETSGPASTAPGQDFLTLLQQALAARGLHYTVAAVSPNATIGPLPLLTPCGSTTVGACLVTLKDRDVVLVNQDTPGLHWWGAQQGNYQTQQLFTPPVPGAEPVSFRRGWTSIEGRYHGRRFHFVTTHLETETFPAVQQAQAAELLAGPAFGAGADLLTGDLNSAADGSSTTTYATVTGRFRDAWVGVGDGPGYTCCHSPALSDPSPALAERIDLVLTHGAWPVDAEVVGDAPFSATAPRWASDHAGVIAALRLGRRGHG
jgi:endonuclease/exonuclease/phosphatase family metal-dependent hydrolase